MFTTIKGLKVHYEVHGEGVPIVLLHGWGGTSLRLYDDVTKYLKENFKVYTIDFPGFGLSEEPTSVWSVYDYADMTQAFLSEMKIENPILMGGHSFGGRVSIILGGDKIPVKKIILVDSAGVKPSRGMNYYRKVYFYKAMKMVEKFQVFVSCLEI